MRKGEQGELLAQVNEKIDRLLDVSGWRATQEEIDRLRDVNKLGEEALAVAKAESEVQRAEIATLKAQVDAMELRFGNLVEVTTAEDKVRMFELRTPPEGANDGTQS
jgi:hypothetical protein